MEVLAIDMLPGRRGMQGWIDYWHGVKGENVTWVLDANNQLTKLYEIITLGQTVVIDGDGMVRYNGLPPEYDRLKKLIEDSI